MNERRIKRLQEQIKARVAEVLLRDLADPELGIVTITRVELDREFTVCRVFWSVIGDQVARAHTERALRRARGFVQREVGATLHTRTVPRLEFRFDAGIAGAIRIQQVLEELREEREARAQWNVRAVPLGDEDTEPVGGTVAERLAATEELTRQAWALSGRPLPRYARAEMPCQMAQLQDQGRLDLEEER